TFELGGPEVFTFKALMEMTLELTRRRAVLVPVPWTLASLIGLAGDLQAMLGMTPQLTSDQVLLLRNDNVVSAGAPGFEVLGVAPTAPEVILPTYLWRYRKGGQFAEALPA